MGAYIAEPDHERFKKYPEVIMIDCTHHMNKENRELCTATNKDRHNNVFAISRCALPSSRNMIFHWLFSSFYKLHFPASIREQLRLIICDADQNECAQIDPSIKLGIFYKIGDKSIIKFRKFSAKS